MKHWIWAVLFVFLNIGVGYAQPWAYDLGSGTGSHTSGVSTSFLPTVPSGSTYARVGTGGGSLNMENPGLSNLGSDTELRIVAASTGNNCKASIYDYSPSTKFHIKFDILFGDASGLNSPASGVFYFCMGNGGTFNSTSGFDGSQAFTILQFTFGTSGAITTKYRDASTFQALGTIPISQGIVNHIEIWGNNSNANATYYRNGSSYVLAYNYQDIWINGTRNHLVKAGISANSSVDSFMFYGESSIGNVANCFIDNIVYSNSYPTYPSSQASNITSSNPASDRLNISWDNGDGHKRIAIINTSNNFIAPDDGTDPEANSNYQSRAQQVVYNGDGNSVTVTGLSPLTTYYFRVYEAYSEGLLTRYNTSTTATNPQYYQTTEQTLPVELSNLTASETAYGSVQLNWITQSETNVYGFYILRSDKNQITDAEIVSPLVGATNTSTQQLYQFEDNTILNQGTYYYWLHILDLDGSEAYHGPCAVEYYPGAQQTNPSIPVLNGINSIYPNPFNPSTTISFGTKTAGDIKLMIYNVKGQLVKSFRQHSPQPGFFKQTWDGQDDNGKACASGVYSVVLVSADTSYIRKVVLMK